SGRRRRASAVRRSGRFRGRSQGEASCAVGSGGDGAGSGGACWGKIVATVPPREEPQPMESQPKLQEAVIWERSGYSLREFSACAILPGPDSRKAARGT